MNHPELNKISYVTRWSFLLAIVPMLVAPLLLLSVGHAFAAQYLNSSEPICNGSDPTVLMCDDFEDGTWYVTNANTLLGKNNPVNDGWAGTIFADNDGGLGFARCGTGTPLGAAGTNCTATTGVRTGARAEAWHWFAPAETQYNEIYHRFYTKFLPGYQFGHEKLVFYQVNETTLGQVGILMTPFGANTFDFQTQAPDNNRYGQNQGNNLSFIPGRWYYVEVRVKLDTPQGNNTGVVQVWADDCGTSGLGCTGPGTLRLSVTGMNIRPSNNNSLGVIWQENWGANTGGNAVSAGEVYNDQVVVRTTRIGPMGVMQPPSNLRVQ